MAACIQRSILPSAFPQADEFSLAASLQTAREVGGDFYDFFTLPDGRWALIIADVSDKGLAAVLSLIHISLAAAAGASAFGYAGAALALGAFGTVSAVLFGAAFLILGASPEDDDAAFAAPDEESAPCPP